MLLLRTVSWVLGVKWFKPDLYQGLAIAGVVGTLVELVQGDPVGILAAGALTSLAGAQIWRITRRTESEVAADEAAIQVAQRRGYSQTEAASALVQAIEAVAKIERRNLNFSELIRTQNLNAIAGISPVGIPEEGIRE
jgi:predicted Zn-dependent protease